MGFTEVLTIVFIVLKLIGKIDWNWFFVLLPEIIAVGLYIVWFLVVAVFMRHTHKEFNKISKRKW